MDLEKRLLKRAHDLEIVKFGQFKLSSGRTRKYYIDCRRLSLDKEGLRLASKIIASRLPKKIRSVGGPASASLPLIAGTLMMSDLKKGFYVRPEVKGHGLQKIIEGEPVSPVALIDDTCTTGGSILRIATLLKEQSIEIDIIFSIFSTKEAELNFEAAKYKYSSIFQIEDGDFKIC